VNESKRKKKKKNREEEKEVKVVQNDENRSIKSEPCRYLAMKPQDVWEEVNKLAKARFDYSFESTLMTFH
jgi:pyrroline-5-carboxylate reductase